MSKAKIIDKKSVDSILGEKNLLSELHHPFIVNMVYSFQDHDYLYLIMDLLPGGNLRYHLGIKRHFNEKQNKFLIGCILVGLEYIHGENILHRDIKPENLVFDENGYLRITDFGIAKKYTVNNKKDTSGTVGYLAPEVLCNENHNFSIDYYAVGIITYELAYGHRPYIGKTKHEVKQLILTRQAHVEYDDLPDGYQNEAADFINKLIQRKPKNRLGKDSINQVINHPWLKGFDWESMKKKTLKAHYIPKDGDNFDKKYCLQNNKMGTETIERYKKITNEPNYDIIFKNFDCEKIPDELKFLNIKNKLVDSLINNNANISSNNSTSSISRNNKLNNNNNNHIDNKKNNHLLANQRNKSMENIFVNQDNQKSNVAQIKNIKNDKENKLLTKQLSAINIVAKNTNDLNIDKDKKVENNNINNNKINNNKINNNNISNNNNNDINNEKENQKENENYNKEYKIIFNKKNDSNIINKFSFSKKNNNNNNNEYKEIYKLKDNTNNNNKNLKKSVSNNIKGKNTLIENIGNLSNIDRNKKKDIINDNEHILLINNSQRISNLNQYISNNTKNTKSNKLSNSNSSINILPNDLFSNIKGNYFKKLINKGLNRDSQRLKNKNNNSLIASNSAKSLFKNNSNIKENSKKHFLKKELFNGTFYPNKSTNTKYFVISNSNKLYKKRKSSATLINKNIDANNKKLTSSSSTNNLIQNKIDNKDNKDNLSGIFSKIEMAVSSNDSKKDINNIDKKLPFINIAVNAKKGSIFRSHLHFVNRNHNNRNYLKNSNGFFSERLKNNDNKKLKCTINDNIINKK